MNLDAIKVAFLVLLLITAILFLLRSKAPVINFGDIGTILLDFLLVPAAMLTAVTFFIIITGTDPMQLILNAASLLTGRVNVNFVDAIPPHLQESLEVVSVERQDTDGDEFNEWVVLYAFDLQTGNNPIKAAIYDTDRGNPPVIFPYQLRPPDRDYVSENSRNVDLSFAQIVEEINGPNDQNLEEILISDSNNLSIFEFKENSELWQPPSDSPPRYQVIGHFRGDGGVNFDAESKRVTVIDRNGFERSQLSIRSIYALNGDTYYDTTNMITLTEQLAAPVISTIDFYKSPPQDILNTSFPEKIVLAFYAASCSGTDQTLCRNQDLIEWDPANFLTGDAAAEYTNRRWGYFGLPAATVQSMSVSVLRYFPVRETETSEAQVTGPQPQRNVVVIEFVANKQPFIETISYEMALVQGEWKILRRVDNQEPLGTPVEISSQ